MRKINLDEITEFVDNKIDKKKKKIVIGFYELKVKRNLSDADVLNALYLISTRLMNLGYKVYKTKEKYMYQEKEYEVQSNELLVAIKE